MNNAFMGFPFVMAGPGRKVTGFGVFFDVGVEIKNCIIEKEEKIDLI